MTQPASVRGSMPPPRDRLVASPTTIATEKTKAYAVQALRITGAGGSCRSVVGRDLDRRRIGAAAVDLGHLLLESPIHRAGCIELLLLAVDDVAQFLERPLQVSEL